jgi:hypothetical protein
VPRLFEAQAISIMPFNRIEGFADDLRSHLPKPSEKAKQKRGEMRREAGHFWRPRFPGCVLEVFD